MSKKANPAVIGGFVVGAVVLIVAGVLIFGGGRFLEKTNTHVLYFDGSVKGLNVGAPVMFRGVTIGSVTDIGVLCDAKDLSFNIRVLIETVRGRIRAIGGEDVLAEAEAIHQSEDIIGLLVERGLRAQLQTQSLVTGQLFVEFDLHPDTPIKYAGIKDEYSEIPTIPSSMEELSKTLENLPIAELVDKFTLTVEGVERLVNSPEMSGSIKQLEQTLIDVRGMTKKVDVQMTALATDFRKTLADTRTLVNSVDNQVAPLSLSVQQTADSTQETLARAEEVLTSLRDATAEGSTLRYETINAIQEVSDAARSIRVLTQTLETRPEALLRGKAPSGGSK